MNDGSRSSDAQQVANRAPLIINSLLQEMFEANEQNTSICLGELSSGREMIQVQLVVTRNPAEFFDADSVMEDDQ